MSDLPDGWLLITDRAPCDGTPVILGWAVGTGIDGEGLVEPGYWETQENHWGEVGWQEEDARQGHYYHRHPMKPTHWRPYPEPPA